MSSPIPPTHGPIAAGSAPSAADARRAPVAFSALPPPQPAVSLQTFPSSPPQEVLDQMAGAARAYDSLQARGRELHFAHDSQSGRMTIEVRDAGGEVLRTISPSEALDVAAGKSLE